MLVLQPCTLIRIWRLKLSGFAIFKSLLLIDIHSFNLVVHWFTVFTNDIIAESYWDVFSVRTKTHEEQLKTLRLRSTNIKLLLWIRIQEVDYLHTHTSVSPDSDRKLHIYVLSLARGKMLISWRWLWWSDRPKSVLMSPLWNLGQCGQNMFKLSCMSYYSIHFLYLHFLW